jgi:hypothetical protein
MAEIPDTMFRQTVRDFMVNQQFRKDYWVKGARHLSLLESPPDHPRAGKASPNPLFGRCMPYPLCATGEGWHAGFG